MSKGRTKLIQCKNDLIIGLVLSHICRMTWRAPRLIVACSLRQSSTYSTLPRQGGTSRSSTLGVAVLFTASPNLAHSNAASWGRLLGPYAWPTAKPNQSPPLAPVSTVAAPCSMVSCVLDSSRDTACITSVTARGRYALRHGETPSFPCHPPWNLVRIR